MSPRAESLPGSNSAFKQWKPTDLGGRIMTVADCPDAGTLRLLLNGTLPEESQARLASHLETCPACRQALDQMATEGDSISGLAKNLPKETPQPEPGLERVLEEAGAFTLLETKAESCSIPLEDLSFLT